MPPRATEAASSLASAAALALAGCGGADQSDEFAARADAICARETTALAALGAADRPTRQGVSALLSEAESIKEQALHGLRLLTAPDDLRARRDQYLATRAEALSVLRAAREAVGRGDRETYDVATAREGELIEEQRAVARQLGLEGCADPAPSRAAPRSD